MRPRQDGKNQVEAPVHLLCAEGYLQVLFVLSRPTGIQVQADLERELIEIGRIALSHDSVKHPEAQRLQDLDECQHHLPLGGSLQEIQINVGREVTVAVHNALHQLRHVDVNNQEA